MTDEIALMPATSLAAAVGGRQLSVRDVAAAALARTETFNPAVNAICTINDRLFEEADALDRRLAAGEPARPLEGVPFLVKDNLFTRGLRTTFGSRLCEHDVPDEDSISVERLRAGGGLLLGKTNTPEFAHDINTTNHLFGTTRNPWDLRCTSGGSSGGTGAAVAARLAPVGLGTDLGGSIRIPSAFNGIAGIRPVPGRVPFYPTEFGWDTLVAHVQGPMAADVADVGLLLEALSGPDDRDPMSLPAQDLDLAAAAREAPDMRGKRIAFSIDLRGLVPVDDEVASLVRAAAHDFAGMGCEVEEDFFDPTQLAEIIRGTRGFGMIARYADRYDAHKESMTPVLLQQIEKALELDVRAVTGSERLRTGYWHQVRRFLQRYDYILAPTVGAPAFRLDQELPAITGGKSVFHDIFLTAYAFSVTGLPAMSVPCGFTVAGLPVGLQIVGPRLREDRVLAAAAAYAAACPQHFRAPQLDAGDPES